MAEFKICITEVLRKTFTIEADSLEDAKSLVEENYRKAGTDELFEDYILDSSDLVITNVEEYEENSKDDHYGI